MSGDELARLLRPQHQPTARFGQGKILAWDPSTFESVVEWQGAHLPNLPVLAGVEALTFQPGDQVLLVGWDGGGQRGAQDWAILSRAIIPGGQAAEQAIAPMRTELARQIAVDVFAQRVHAAQADAEVEITSSSWQSAPGGPTVADVEVSEAGVALVTIGARLAVDSFGSTGQDGLMSFQVDGPTSVAPDFARSAELTVVDMAEQVAIGSTPLRQVVLTGLAPGRYSFSARYATTPGGSGRPAWFEYRSISVIAL